MGTARGGAGALVAGHGAGAALDEPLPPEPELPVVAGELDSGAGLDVIWRRDELEVPSGLEVDDGEAGEESGAGLEGAVAAGEGSIEEGALRSSEEGASLTAIIGPRSTLLGCAETTATPSAAMTATTISATVAFNP